MNRDISLIVTDAEKHGAYTNYYGVNNVDELRELVSQLHDPKNAQVIMTLPRMDALEADSLFRLRNQYSIDNRPDNNFECSSNLCVDNQCVEQGVFSRFIRWFRRFWR